MNLKQEHKISLRQTFEKCIKQKFFKKAISLACKYKLKGVFGTAQTIKVKYGLSNLEISKLQCVEVDNPHFKCAAPMKLYLLAQAEHLANLPHSSSKT
ncbi:hypothetical protein H9Y05_06765 [Crocinitomicaceae bacterium CZZ-1]|uniref:Uncharacterized protein n=1 Tax=Taishania pollutisoli TaxID=2766479 RepID=A0A8J6PBJ2_9FLAO|nr:hypothetical protein [Taishania pollutisoli]MBC9812178.1 hypothetical protein [Taishania pollutisoli]